jgi:hypothetical protein
MIFALARYFKICECVVTITNSEEYSLQAAWGTQHQTKMIFFISYFTMEESILINTTKLPVLVLTVLRSFRETPSQGNVVKGVTRSFLEGARLFLNSGFAIACADSSLEKFG